MRDARRFRHSSAVSGAAHNFSRVLLMLFYVSYLSLKMGFHFFAHTLLASSFQTSTTVRSANEQRPVLRALAALASMVNATVAFGC